MAEEKYIELKLIERKFSELIYLLLLFLFTVILPLRNL